MEGCKGNMHNTALVDILIQEPEGNKTEICYGTAEPSDPTYAGDPVSQAPRASTTEAAPSDSQVIPTGMPDPTPEVTTLQVQHTQGEEEQEIDVVRINEAEPNNIETTATVVDARSKKAIMNTVLPL